MSLSFTVVAPTGTRLHEEVLESVVLRRREAEFSPGSEVAILPKHGPMLMQTQAGTARITRRGVTHEVEVGPGVLEVYRDQVTLVET